MALSPSSVKTLRSFAIARNFSDFAELKSVIHGLGFVQADPIRSPARAQDLILRQRVSSYRAGDLESQYSELGLEEDMVYAYGFIPRRVWEWLHPRPVRPLEPLEKKILKWMESGDEAHPKEVEKRFGGSRVVNAWGGFSQATKRALDHLHQVGELRVSRRENGIRLYQKAPPVESGQSVDDRFLELLRLIARIKAPVDEKFLLSESTRFRYLAPTIEGRRVALEKLIQSGEFERIAVDGVTYVLPADEKLSVYVRDTVRVLAPFDPLIRDRSRFEHFWGWTYRFEAYIPKTKRVRGYYAMPLLWRDVVLGWVNASVKDSKLLVEIGFEGARPRSDIFKNELEKELSRLAVFLGLDASAWEMK